jgi:predicted Zn-dependent protease
LLERLLKPLFDRNMDGTGMSRRDFLWLTSLSAAGVLTGCATNPVTGKSQLMLVSEQSEIDMDRQHSPQQFSADYGATQDEALNRYIQQIGKKMAAATHRSHMPYSFRCVNATYINAYAFPGGSIATTRGIMLTLEDEAELAALLGHELGHVNARHTAQQMSKGMLTQMVVGGVAVYAGSHSAALGDIASSLGSAGAGALLAYYSRDNEREADALGLSYMVKTRYSSDGFVGLMDMLNNLSKHKASAAELLFATHPMGSERYQTAVQAVKTQYAAARKNPRYRERYMDKTAGLRAIKGAIVEMQKGDKAMAQKKVPEAETHYRKALKQAPQDYTALVVMAKCQLVQKKFNQAGRYIDKA